jgi:hypothetical protein
MENKYKKHDPYMAGIGIYILPVRIAAPRISFTPGIS